MFVRALQAGVVLAGLVVGAWTQGPSPTPLIPAIRSYQEWLQDRRKDVDLSARAMYEIIFVYRPNL